MHLSWVGVVLLDHLSGHASDQRRFSAVAVLLPWVSRVPAVERAAEHPLRWVDDDEAFTVGQAVELRRGLHRVPSVARHATAVNCHDHRQLGQAIVLRRQANLITQRTGIAFVQVIVVSRLHPPGQAKLERRRADANSGHDCDEDAGGDPGRSPSLIKAIWPRPVGLDHLV